MNKQKAKHILKNTGYIGNEVGVAFDVAIKSMDKLEQIEQIVERFKSQYDHTNSLDLLVEIKEILEQE